MRVFVNATPLEVEPGTDVQAAVQAHDSVLGAKLASGAAYATDARGIELPLGVPLSAGSIVRVVVSARREASGGEGDDADA
jgi:hypothetical protein